MIECPGCGGNLRFDIASAKLKCTHCDSLYDPYAFDNKTNDADLSQYEVTVYTCPQCGGELYSTDTDATAFCSFCGASNILMNRVSKELRPDFIIPFKITKEDCKTAYQKLAKKSLFLPSELKDAKHIDGFRGIYMPYWSYNRDQKGHLEIEGEKTHRKGDYIYHDHYNLSGELDAYYHGVTYDASSTFDDALSAGIAPYNIKEKVEFTPAYLSGFYADTADVSEDTYAEEATKFAKKNTLEKLKKSFAAYQIDDKNMEAIASSGESVERTMFPVWFMSYRNKDRVAYAVVNGQTGKVAADLPIDEKKYLLASALLAVPLFLILSLFTHMTPRALTIMGVLMLIATGILYLTRVHAIKKRERHAEDAGYLSTHQETTENESQKDKKKKSDTGLFRYVKLFPVIAMIVVSVLVFLSGSIHDELYYGCAIMSAVAIAVSFIDILKLYNVSATRALPQFEKKGGDDCA